MAQPDHYECIGKGGKYKIISKPKGAGTSQGVDIVVYEDTETRSRYYRTVEDFELRMKLLKPTCSVCGTEDNLYDDGWYGWRCTSRDCCTF